METTGEDTSNFPDYQDNFEIKSFAPSTDLPLDESPDEEIYNYQASSKSSLSPWKILPTIDLNLIIYCIIRQRSLNMIENILSSSYLEKQQRSFLEKVVLYNSNRNPQPKFSRVFFRHLLTFLLVSVSIFLSFNLFIVLWVLTYLIFFFQIKVILLYSVILMYSTFPKVLQDLTRLEDIFKEFSKALKLQKQIRIVEKSCFRAKTPFRYNDTHLTNLKQQMTGLYYEIFTSLRTKSDYFSLQSSTFQRDEMICTLKIDDILFQIYKEPLDGIQDLSAASMSLDSFRMWHCLVTCQYSEYIEILVNILCQNFLLPNSPLKQLHMMRSIESNRLLKLCKYEDGFLSQLVYLTKSDVYSSDLNLTSFNPTDVPTEKDTFDKIDLILQCCIVKLRNLNEMESIEKNEEIQFLKLNLENALEGLKNICEPIQVETSIHTFPDDQAKNGFDAGENELILPKSDTLEVPECMEVVFEGVSRDESDTRKDLCFESGDQTYLYSTANKSVLSELKCVLASKKVKNCDSENNIPSQKGTTDDNFMPHTEKDIVMDPPASSCSQIREDTEPKLSCLESAHSLLSLAVLSSGRNKQLEQTVIGDDLDSD